jgi:hypothetical protein
MESATPEPATPTPEKKSWFETVVTSTPVLLTVIATFMIGQSSGEMTRAQYYRSLASQNQSKVGDQWGFFQAKRIRGQILEGNADLLLAQKGDVFSQDTFPDAAQGMVKELRAAEKNIATLTNESKLSAVTEEIDKDLKALVADAEKSVALAKNLNVQAAIDALKPKTPKKSKSASKSEESKSAIDADQAAMLKEIINDIKKRKHESEIAPKALKITDETLNQAIKEAEGRADEVYRRGKDIENILEEFDSLLDQQTALAFEYHQLGIRLKVLLDKTGLDAPGKDAVFHEALRKHRETADAIRALNAKLQGDYKAARNAFRARRYEDDARNNQDSAYLYEVKVFLSSARSDKHLFRSKMFLFAMLVAQVGVTIATLAMAVRQKSVFWLLAALTGVIAIAFGTYVYLDLWPIPMF